MTAPGSSAGRVFGRLAFRRARPPESSRRSCSPMPGISDSCSTVAAATASTCRTRRRRASARSFRRCRSSVYGSRRSRRRRPPAPTGVRSAPCPRPGSGGGFEPFELRFDLAALLLFALDVDAPAGQLGREPDVLALLADRQRQLLVLDDHFHHALAIVDDRDALHLRRAERVGDERDRDPRTTRRCRSSRRAARG